MTTKSDFRSIRQGIAEIPADVSNDAVGAHAPRLEDIFAPEAHAAALDPNTPIVVGSRGAGKSFWSGVLGQTDTRLAASEAYPRLGLKDTHVYFGYTGVAGENGIGVDALNACVPVSGSREDAKAFWWATILRALWSNDKRGVTKLSEATAFCKVWELREEELNLQERRLSAAGDKVLIVFDALDTVAIDWERRRLLTEALLEVVWATRAYRQIKVKLFLRPDQIDDDALKFVELPKLRTGAVRLAWGDQDLYGLFFSRLALSKNTEVSRAFKKVLKSVNLGLATNKSVLSRQWSLVYDRDDQVRVMEMLAGPYMASGVHGYKKGRTYAWPLTHLADAFNEVTPRSFLGLMIAAAKTSSIPDDGSISPDGLRHGLRAASRTRVDQLHLEFPWIKGVLAPLSGLLLPQKDQAVFKPWKQAKTLEKVKEDARTNSYLPPFHNAAENEEALFVALEGIGVMFRRKDNRLDMPDLFRVAAKLLKKGGTAPL